MSSIAFCRAGIAALALWIAAGQAAPPGRITLHYDMSRNGTVLGYVVETLEHDGESYTITSELRGRGILALFGVLKRTSRGRVTPQGLRPDEFRDQRGSSWAVSAKFDWDAHSVTQERKGESETLKMQGTAQDPLSLAYSFAFAPPKSKEYEVTRADGRGLTPFRFTVVGNEKLATPAGEMQTLHVAKVRDGPEDKSTDIWFATERDFLPVRVLVVDNDGTRADQIVTRIGN
ncbi:MAG TPA: DUF3108 domain-containing protein [Burkholderiales bacterium]|nr:DUF3108 domain-containing protein [Burkholderiales bacterium]